MSTDTKIKTLIFNKLTQEQYNNADRVPTEFYLTPDTSIDSSEKGAANGVASLDTNGKVPTEQIPTATTSIIGGVKPDGNTITVTEDGTISASVSGEGVATKAELQAVDISKADTSLSNTTPSQSFKEMSVGWGFPDYSTGVQISGSSYTATYKCWLIGTTLVSTLTSQTLYVNGHMVGKEEGDYIDVQMPIDVGDVVTVSGGSFDQLFVYAIKGAN